MNQADLFAGDRGRAAIALGPVGRVVSLAVVAIAIVAYVAGPILDQRIPEVFRHIDWVSYSRAAQRFVDGQPLYTAVQLAGPYRMADVAGLGYVYPPPSILLFVPFLALGPTAWAIVNAGLFASGLAAMARRDFGRYAAVAFGVALLLFGLSTPYLDAMVMGNSNLGVAGLFAWAWVLGRGARPVGLLAALGGVFKLHPFALAGWTRPAEARRTIGVAIAVAVAIVLVTLPIVGIRTWLDYAQAAANTQPLCGYGLDAVACRLVPILGGLTTPVLVAISGSLVLFAIRVRGDAIAFALIVLAIFILLPEVFGHTLLIAEVLLFALAGSVARGLLAGRGWTGLWEDEGPG